MMFLDLAELRAANLRRDAECFHHLSEWSQNDWAVALAGEVGELCNILKKVRRGDYTNSSERHSISLELADILIYLDLLAASMNMDLAAATRYKFNEVSRKRNVEIFL